MDSTTNAALILSTLRKILAALQGVRRAPVIIGGIAHQCWGVKGDLPGVELLIPPGAEHRQAIFGAARGEGMTLVPDKSIDTQDGVVTLRMTFTDAKLNATATVNVIEATTPFLASMHSRAKEGHVLNMPLPLATCEDLIVKLAMSNVPTDRAVIVELLKFNAGRIDAPYVKKAAEAAGVFEQVKSAWQEAKK